jgi:4-hydroxy-tetrahydrodipicolinate synthase
VPPGIVVALLTPFTERGSIDAEALAGHLEALVEEGVDAVMPAGTTGEGPLLDEDEVVDLVRLTVAAARGRIPVMAHVGRMSTRGTVRLADRALAAGASAVSAVVPAYYPLEEEQVIRHYRALLQASPASGAYAYTIPARTGNDLSPEAARTLAAEGLAGVKDSTKSLDRHLSYLRVARDHPGFEVLMGSDGMVLPALDAGASGCVSAVANARPDLLVRLRHAFVEGDRAAMEEAQGHLSRVREELSQGSLLLKLKEATSRALRARGVRYATHVRAPLG